MVAKYVLSVVTVALIGALASAVPAKDDQVASPEKHDVPEGYTEQGSDGTFAVKYLESSKRCDELIYSFDCDKACYEQSPKYKDYYGDFGVCHGKRCACIHVYEWPHDWLNSDESHSGEYDSYSFENSKSGSDEHSRRRRR